jgi:hypothetical protein
MSCDRRVPGEEEISDRTRRRQDMLLGPTDPVGGALAVGGAPAFGPMGGGSMKERVAVPAARSHSLAALVRPAVS